MSSHVRAVDIAERTTRACVWTLSRGKLLKMNNIDVVVVMKQQYNIYESKSIYNSEHRVYGCASVLLI